MKHNYRLIILIFLALTSCGRVGPGASPAPAGRSPTSTMGTSIPKPQHSLTASTPSPLPPPGLQSLADIRLRYLPGAGRSPAALALLDGQLYVANWNSNNVSVIQDDHVIAVVDVGEHPGALAADPAHHQVYVASRQSHSITALQDGHPTSEWHVDGAPRSLALLGNRLYVGLDDRGGILVYSLDRTEMVAEIALPDAISVLSLAAGEDQLFAKTLGHIYQVDPATGQVKQDMPLPNTYTSLAVDKDFHHILVDQYDSAAQKSFLVAVDSAAGDVVARVALGGDLRGVAIDRAAYHAYVVSQFTRDVFVVNLADMTQLTRIPVGLDPEGVALDKRTHRLYVANRGSQSISVIDTAIDRVVSTIPLAVNPQGLATDEERNTTYVAIPSTGSVLAVTEQKVKDEIFIGGHPTNIAVDSRTQRAYVVDRAGQHGVVIALRSHQVLREIPLASDAAGATLDVMRNRVYLGDTILDAASGDVVGHIAVPTNYSGVLSSPIQVLSTPDRLYVLAPNGTPGSNFGMVITALAGNPPAPAAASPSHIGGLSTTGLAWDSTDDTLYSTAFKMGYAWLYVNDGGTGKLRVQQDLDSYPAALAVNPNTHHLALGLVSLHRPGQEEHNRLRILDTRTLETVFEQTWPGEFGSMVFDTHRNRLLITDSQRGLLSIWKDFG